MEISRSDAGRADKRERERERDKPKKTVATAAAAASVAVAQLWSLLGGDDA